MSFRRFINEARLKLPLTTMQKIFYASLIALGALTGLFIAYIIITFTELRDIKPLENYSTYAVPTKVYDINNNLITEFYQQKRELVSYRDLPDSLIKAIIAIEDNEFYRHHGFNFFAFIRGVILDPITGKRARGASTLTQQLAKNLFTTRERSVFRKIVELWYAFQIEKKYSKQEILELYFNQVYFGHGCYGVQTASHFFFDKDVKDLTLGESALLAGLVQLPEAYSPIFYPNRAQIRQKKVLNSMVKLGYITKEEAEDTFEYFWNNYDSIIKLKGITVQKSMNNPAPFFTEYIRQILIDRYGEEKLYRGGLQIYTTLDIEKQKIANDEIANGVSNEQLNYDRETKVYSQVYKNNYQDVIDLLSLTFGIDSIKIGANKVKDRLESIYNNYNDVLYLSSFVFGLDGMNKKIKVNRYRLKALVKQKEDQIEGALISVNPNNGYIEALVGGREFTYANQYNRAVQAKRQMGSMFKPAYYAIAIEKKVVTPASVYLDAPMIYEDPSGRPWEPRNYEGTFRGKLRIRQALQYSCNVVSVQVWDQLLKTVGYNNMISSLSSYFGIDQGEMRKRVGPSLSYALGVGVFSPLEVARLFSVFANDGIAVKPIAILKVKDRFGRVIDDFERERELDKNSKVSVMSPGAAFIMQSMLYDVLYKGTGAGAVSATGFNFTAGGKTGTTPNWKDAWFAGFTKNLTTVVWLGFDDARKSLGRHRAAAYVAAPIWMRYMKQVCSKQPDIPFTPSQDIIEVGVCASTGLLPTQYCPRVISEYFIRNTAPVTKCNVHVSEETARDDEEREIYNITNTLKIDELKLDIEEDTNKKGKEENLNEILKEDKFNIKSGIE